MNILRVNGVTLPTPSKMEYKEADLQLDGYRDELGYIHKTTVRWGVRSIHTEWERNLTNYELTTIRNAVRGQEYITVEYYMDNGTHTGTMTAYSGADMDYELIRVESDSSAIWHSLTLDFIEQ